MRELLQHGADVTSLAPDGRRALRRAAMLTQGGAVGMLIEAGADVDTPREDVAEWAPLHWATSCASYETVATQGGGSCPGRSLTNAFASSLQ